VLLPFDARASGIAASFQGTPRTVCVLPLIDDFAVVEPPTSTLTGVGKERAAAVDIDGPAPVVFLLVALERGDDELAYVGSPHPTAHEGPSLPHDPVAPVGGRKAEDQGDQDSAEDALHGRDDSGLANLT